MEWHERISIDPAICHGKARIKGTRVMVSVILENLAAGESWESIKEDYYVTSEDIQAALRYAANIIKDSVFCWSSIENAVCSVLLGHMCHANKIDGPSLADWLE